MCSSAALAERGRQLLRAQGLVRAPEGKAPDLGRRSIPGLETLGPEAMQALQDVGEIINDVETDDVPAYEVRIEGETVSVRL